MAINPDMLNEITNNWLQFYIELDLTPYSASQITNFFSIEPGSAEYNALSNFKSLVLLAVRQANPELKAEGGIRMWRSNINNKKWLFKVYIPQGIASHYDGIPESFSDNVRKVCRYWSQLSQALKNEYDLNEDVNLNILRLNTFAGVEA